MKLLLLLRHAAAGAGVDDHERRLSGEGRAQAAGVAERLAADGLRPDLVLSSSARRALETLEPLTLGPAAPPVEVTERLYLAPAADLLSTIRDVDDGVERLLVVGHNPGLQRLALALAADAEQPALRHFPPATLVVLHFDVAAWGDLDEDGGRVVVTASG